jgi:hypothetical protein
MMEYRKYSRSKEKAGYWKYCSEDDTIEPIIFFKNGKFNKPGCSDKRPVNWFKGNCPYEVITKEQIEQDMFLNKL